MPPSPARTERLAALRAEVRALESAGAGEGRSCLPFGIQALDSRLAGGGLPIAALNEAAGERPGPADRGRGDPVPGLYRRPPPGDRSVGARQPRPVRARPGRRRPVAGSIALRRMRPRRGCACGDGGGASPRRPRRGGRRGRARGHDRHPPPPARRRGGRNARPDAPALAGDKRGSARHSFRRRHPLAPRLRPVLALSLSASVPGSAAPAGASPSPASAAERLSI